MKRTGRTAIVLGMTAAVFLLTGCGKLSEQIRERVTEGAEDAIQNSEKNRLYEQYRSEGLLGEDGLYRMSEAPVSAPTPDPRSLRVTIASNSFLSCTYYTDEETKVPLTESDVYLLPGESLYVQSVSVNNNVSSLYDFSRFRIWSYDKDGRRSSIPYCEAANRTGLIFTVPEGFNGAGFSVEPLGAYTSRHITANAYYIADGTKTDLPNGRWEANDEPFTGSIDLSPVDSYTIIYSYEAYKDDYYFVDSSPKCWYSKESSYSVIFREVSSNEQETAFSVEMHPYITMNVSNSSLSLLAGMPVIGDHGEGIIKSVARNGEPITQDFKEKSSFPIEKLKVGDTITIRVGKEYKITGTNVDVGPAVPLGSNAENGYEYTIKVPDTRNHVDIEISARNSNAEGKFAGYELANADVVIMRANKAVLELGSELPGDDEKVSLIIRPHEGYYIEGFTEKDYTFVRENIKFSKLEQEIQSILNAHTATPFLTLDLVFSDEAGTFTYKLDGKDVTDTPLTNVRIGQTLKAEYATREGYAIVHRMIGANTLYTAYTWAGGQDSISESIKIAADMDGTTIDRDVFGIVVEKTEGTFRGLDPAETDLHADITITRKDGALLKVGDELPDGEKVTITITPHDGYYIDGFTEKDTFAFVRKNVKFSKLEQELQGVLSEHPAVPFLTLDLVFSDEAGTFTYKLDGKDVTGTPLTNVRVGQTLRVEYKAREGFTLTHSWFGATAFYSAVTWAGGQDSISESIRITADMDGAAIDRDTFGITVERKG